MTYLDRETLLGGESAHVLWEDLTARQIVQAVGASIPRARDLLVLVDTKLTAAHELKDVEQLKVWSDAQWIISQIAGISQELRKTD